MRRRRVLLQSDLLELRQKMGASLSERYVSQQKGTARVMVEHDRLRRDLQKVGIVLGGGLVR